MTEIMNVTENLIRRVKRDTDMSGIRFIKAYSSRNAQRSPSGMSVYVDFISIEKRREFFGGLYKGRSKSFSGAAVFNLRLSCGIGGSGDELGKTALRLVEKLRNADVENYIEDYSIGSVVYDRDLGTIYRDIRLVLGFVYGGEV